MKIFSTIISQNLEKIEEDWNDRHKSQIEFGTVAFDVLADKNEYQEFKDQCRLLREKSTLYYSEELNVTFEPEEYLRMDKLYLRVLPCLQREQRDMEKSYVIEKCEVCGALLKRKKFAPLFFSGEVFEEALDDLDINLTITSDMFLTTFGELVVSERVKKLFDKIKGAKCEQVLFEYEDLPGYYHVTVEEEIGALVSPIYTRKGVLCSACGIISTEFPYADFVSVRLESTPFFSSTWNNWALKFIPDNTLQSDIQLTQMFGDRSERYSHFIISTNLYKMLIDNDIKDFNVGPVQLPEP